MTPRLPPGLALGALGVLGFSFSLPATRLAVADLDPWFVACGRAAVAALLALGVLRGAPRPTRQQWRGLAVVGAGVVLGFPICTSLALEHRPAGQGAVVIAVLPAVTAMVAALRGGERPGRRFWWAAGAGCAAALAFAVAHGATTPGGVGLPEAELALAVVLCAAGYAEGGRLARELGGARTICWALVLCLPVTLAVAALRLPDGPVGADAWLGFAYVALVSMFLGFFAWYAGLARGGVARVGQVQLAQPVLSLGWAALVLGESVGSAELGTAVVVLACVVATQRAR